MDKIRLDKYLWIARFYKTRALATEMVNGGKVHYNEQRCKPSKIVEIGAKIQLQQGFEKKEIIVQNFMKNRGNAVAAQTLYIETQDSIKNREKNALYRQLNAVVKSEHKPNKKERRDLLKFKQK